MVVYGVVGQLKAGGLDCFDQFLDGWVKYGLVALDLATLAAPQVLVKVVQPEDDMVVVLQL